MSLRPSQPTIAADVLDARFGLHVAALLSEQSEQLPHDVSERLKVARQQAISARRRPVAVAGTAVRHHGATLSLGGGSEPRWLRWVSVLPLLVLVAGLFLIQYEHRQELIEVAADIDAALLGDDLPPAAYRDAGFVEFLKTPRD